MNTSHAKQPPIDDDPLVARVKHAMLTMQRASWEQGVAAQAYLELGDHDTAYMLVKELVLRQADDGRLGVVYTDHGSTDGAMGGEALAWAARRSGDPELQAGLDRQVEWILHKCPRSSDGILYHRLYDPEMWIDQVNTVPPLLIAVGKVDEAMQQFQGYRKLLWDPVARLYRHQWSDKTKTFVNPNHWGVGNGWVASALTRMIVLMPAAKQAERQACIDHVGELVDGCLTHLRSDGLFHNNVDQTDTFVETNLSQMLAYAICRGIAGGWIDRKYIEPAEKMRAAARAKVDQYGYVQGVCGAPRFSAPGRATEGQAFFLRMEAAQRELATSS